MGRVYIVKQKETRSGQFSLLRASKRNPLSRSYYCLAAGLAVLVVLAGAFVPFL